MMEMKYMGIPVSEQADEELTPAASSRRTSSPAMIIRRIFQKANTYLQITSPGYQHGAPERKLSFAAFLLMFVCFIFTAFFVFTGGDVCSSHQQGLERLRAERDQLQTELNLLRGAPPNNAD